MTAPMASMAASGDRVDMAEALSPARSTAEENALSLLPRAPHDSRMGHYLSSPEIRRAAEENMSKQARDGRRQ